MTGAHQTNHFLERTKILMREAKRVASNPLLKMKILALDVATHLGFCYYDTHTGFMETGEMDFTRFRGSKRKKADHPGKSLELFQTWIQDVIFLYGEIDRIGYERPGHLKGVNTREALLGFRGILYAEASKAGIPIYTIPPNSLKKWATGNGAANKKRMIQAAEQGNSFKIYSDNVADAVCLARWTAEQK